MDVASRKYRSSKILKRSWRRLLNQTWFTSFPFLVVIVCILKKLSTHCLKEEKNMKLVQAQQLNYNFIIAQTWNIYFKSSIWFWLMSINVSLKLNLVRRSTRIIYDWNNWIILLFKEAYHIKIDVQYLIMVLKRLWMCNFWDLWILFNYNLYAIHIFIAFLS